MLCRIKRAIRTAAVIAAILAAASPAFAWKFASIADSRGDTNGVNAAELTKIINKINQEHVDLVIFEGDSINGGCDDACLASQLDTWLSVMKGLDCPWYYSPGNHELSSATAENVLRTKIDMPAGAPAGYEETVYSFDHENAHFVCLNSNHYGNVHHIQQAWLDTDLAANHKPHVFVYAHEPAYPAGPHTRSSLDADPAARDTFWRSLARAGVGMYFCGHEHLYARSKHQGVTQVINGTCGAPINSGYTNTIAKYHYVLVNVDGNSVHAEAKDDTGALLDSWDYSAAPTCDSLRFIPDGTDVTLPGKVVTYSSPKLIYVEEADRSSAFRAGLDSGAAVGSRMTVYGTLQTLDTGERQISGSAIGISAGNPVPAPFWMRGRDLLGGARGYTLGASDGLGLNNSGLLVRCFGRVSSASAGQFYLDDGSGVLDGTAAGSEANVGVRVISAATVTPQQFVTVTGVSSCFTNPAGALCRQILASSVQ